jgi:hypothetical protein
MRIEFVVVKTRTQGNVKEKEVLLPEDAPDDYLGAWSVCTLMAQDGIDALDELIMANDDYKENPDLITETVFRKKMIEKATAQNGKPVAPIDLRTMPTKLWHLLTAANQKLNGISDSEARFLLEPSASANARSTQP